MNRQPLQPLNARQVHNVRCDPLYCERDSENQKQIARKRGIEKPPLARLDLGARKRVCEEILN